MSSILNMQRKKKQSSTRIIMQNILENEETLCRNDELPEKKSLFCIRIRQTLKKKKKKGPLEF